MKRRDALKTMAGLAAAATWAETASARQGPGSAAEEPLPAMVRRLLPMMDGIPIQAAPLGPGLTLFSGPGGNVAALAGPEGIVMVDSFVQAKGADLAALVRPLAAGPITLINTHWHFDHAGGNAAIAALGARIVAHENTRKRLAVDQFMVDFEQKVPASPPAALPSVTIGHSGTIFANGEEIHLTHVAPAHTDSDVFIHFRKANILHTGDLFSNGFYPNIDSSSGGWIGGMVAASDAILAVADDRTRIIPGHGPVGTKAQLKASRDMLATAREKVEPLVAAGKTRDEVIAAKPLADLDGQWARGFLKGSHFTQLVYSGLVKHREKAGA